MKTKLLKKRGGWAKKIRERIECGQKGRERASGGVFLGVLGVFSVNEC